MWLLTAFQLFLSAFMVQGASDMLTIGKTIKNLQYFTIKEAAPMLVQKEACEKRGGRLAVLSSLKKTDIQKINLGVHTDVWVGLTDVLTEGTFVWFSGNKKASYEQIKWDSGEPNNANGNEDCATLKFSSRTLNDADCDQRSPGLCQYDPNAETSKNENFGVIFDSKLLKGALKVTFAQDTTKLIIAGQMDVNVGVKELAIFVLRRNSSEDSICGSPTPIMQIYQQFFKMIHHQKTKKLFAKEFIYPGRITFGNVFDSKEIKDDEITNYGIVVREIGVTRREIACSGVKKYSDLEWSKRISEINSAVSMGKW